MSYIHYYDRDCRPLDMETYSRLISDWEYKRVIAHDVGPYWISTVWLGLDHAFLGGPPLIFESMVFHSNSWDDALREDLDCVRYATEHQALLGHYRIKHEVEEAIEQGRPYNGYTDYAET